MNRRLPSLPLAGMILFCLLTPYLASQDMTVSSNATWPEGTYSYTSLTVTNGATLQIGGGSTLNLTGALRIVGTGSTLLLGGKNTTGQVNGQWAGVGVRSRREAWK